MTNERTNFFIDNIIIEQFATFPENYQLGRETQLRTGFNFVINWHNRILACRTEYLLSQEQTQCLKMELTVFFAVSQNLWDSFLNEKEKKITFPREFGTQLANITVDSARGILFAKTENTAFAPLIIPFIHTSDGIPDDLTFITPE